MTSILVDTVGLLALWDEDDQWHDVAERAWAKIISLRVIPYTTSFVLLECANAASRRSFRAEVDLIRRQFERARTLISPTDQEWAEAWDHYHRGNSGSPGVVDHVSFLIMRRIGITDAFTNDRHFKAAGFNTLF